MHGDFPRIRRTLSLWCGIGAVLGGSLGPAAQSAHALTAEIRERATTCAAPGPIAHASAGLDFGGKELSTASAARTAAAITVALTAGPLPAGARVVGSRVLLPDGQGSFTVGVEHVRMPGTLAYAPVASVHFLGSSAAVVRVSDRATADLIRQAVAARLAEVAAIVSDRSQNRRLDVTSGLTEGVLTTADSAGRIPLSPRDIGRVTALKILGDQLPSATTRVKTAALGSAIAMGLLDEEPSRPVHRMEGNAPLVGVAAAAARAASVRVLAPGSAAALDKVLELARQTGSQASLKDIRAERECERRVLREQADGVIARRTAADAELTKSLNARDVQLPVIPHVIVGGGWAATVDYLTLPPVADAGADVPPVLTVSAGYGVVNDLGEFRLTQPAMDNELPGAPFQPGDFAEDRSDFVMSTAFGRAVGVARALAGMPTYQANVTGIEARPAGTAAADWPAGARYRLTTGDRRTLYASSLDLATGLGPPRIPQATGDQLAGRTFVDPGTGYQVAFGPAGDTRILDPQGEPYTGQLPANAAWLLGVQNVEGTPKRLYEPFLLDPLGRPTERRVIDPESRYSVDPQNRTTYTPDGAAVDPASLDPDLRARLGFRPEGYRDPRFVADQNSPYSVHPVTGAVVLTLSGEPVDRTTLPPQTLTRLDALVRAHRVQYGGQNTSADYRADDDLLVVGGGAGGASEVEQAHYVTRQVTWGARPARKLEADYPRGPEGALDPKGLRAEWDAALPARKTEIQRDLSFVSGGFNRRNTLPAIGAFSLPVWEPTLRTTDLPVTVRYTTTGRFGTADLQGRLSTFSRIVYTIGQEADYPGGAATLLGPGTLLAAVLGPDGSEVNGLRDAPGTLRVLGAASVTPGVLRLTGAAQPVLTDKIKAQADVLPPDARTIHPSIRYHAGRIAEMNRTFQR
ncbi:hypothetical protein ACGFYY_36670 [Streptomyces sp. NPDC048331]|uniref:hypothetical protein n=1 Tax=Streptomyces sp. NPDC048331 TaxID=3365534 RepID=UPI0037220811